uniref:PDZ domain-containing protein n=1 Tax=Globisporangium ultimum (strain ATCC 200006 / CBS 805.95 / DAOM BR144) TaxID=431595 RepID=K3WER4_GLOUD
MGFFSSIKKKTRAESACATDRSLAASHIVTSSAPSRSAVYEYVGGEFGITFQRSKSKYVDAAGPTRIQWRKEQRLGITFVEKAGGGIVVKSADGALSEVSVGQELIGVNGTPVVGLDFVSVMDRLKAAASPCQLDFTPPPSPIVVSEVLDVVTIAHGVETGMVLQSVNGVSMIGASLADVNNAVIKADERQPAVLKFAPPMEIKNCMLTRSDSAPKSGLRNTACVAAVVAVLAV